MDEMTQTHKENIVHHRALNKMFYSTEKGKIRKWGRVLDIKNGKCLVFLSTNPIGYRIYEVKAGDVIKWLDEKQIFQKPQFGV